MNHDETPDDVYWVQVNTDTDEDGSGEGVHPYAMHREVNRRDVDVINCVSDSDNHPRRWVVVRSGEIEVFVIRKYMHEYGYALTDAERVSDVEVEAINLKHTAMSGNETVEFTDAVALVESETPEQSTHGLIAAYYVAKNNDDFTEEDVDELRELVHEKTSHVDISHSETVKEILSSVDEGELAE